ncbi:hypothetical protein FQN54_006669 [Arachnomyces sp. PD_36]|nr:hypothetical protein FQN54_006669 [Arachnomyces sp. PD_36]
MGSQKKELPPIRACLFDMDGLLIDSEDKYTLITNLILQEYGKPNLPWSIKAQLQGRPAPQVHIQTLPLEIKHSPTTHSPQTKATKIFDEWAQLPISREEYYAKQAALQAVHFPTSQPLPGVETLLSSLASTASTSSPVHIALATSSQTKNFIMKTSHLEDLFSVFTPERRILGDDPRIPPGRGKPLGDIYLVALEAVNKGIRAQGNGEPEVKPEECLVFEDSVPGVEAGRRAGMQVIWCPHKGLREEYRGREEEVLAGATGEHKEEAKPDAEKLAEKIGGEMQQVGNNGDGKPGELGDGWGQFLDTLESFPYEQYGIKIP